MNLSARQFQEKNLVATIAAAIEECGLPPGVIELELTESVIMRDAPEAARRLRDLTSLGISLAIDDFGTGYSSLRYLKDFPISALKIDRAFIRDVEREPSSAILAQAIIALATSLNLKVVAEGVETREQVELLRRAGCHELQGSVFSRPLPAEDLLPLLSRRLESKGVCQTAASIRKWRARCVVNLRRGPRSAAGDGAWPSGGNGRSSLLRTGFGRPSTKHPTGSPVGGRHRRGWSA